MEEKNGESRDESKLCNGFSDNLIPTEPLDLSKINTVNDLVKAMSKTAFGGRTVGEAADVLYEMINDKDCFKVLTLAGAMTVAKMGLIVCDMIDNNMADCIISTGALMAHGFVESVGMTHFKYSNEMSDKELYYKGYDRVYDTIELEKNLDDTEEIIREVISNCNPNEELGSYMIHEKLGEYLVKNTKGRGILKSAFLKKIPIYVPAFTDSELGLDIGILNRKRKLDGKTPFKFNPFLDLEHYTENIKKSKKIGIFTIGGGVPRNWGQQVGPYLDIIQKRIGQGGGFKRFHYGVRICPEPVHWGGLSGCTYSEGVSWGKMVPKSEGGKFAEVYCDATIAWPLIVKAVLERLMKKDLI
jgi:deoxyhypusine synthase